VIFTVQTINEEKKELEQVIEQVEQAKSESRSKSTFLANMSHEIRTPINTILGLDTMILRESTEGSVRRYAKDIKSAGDMLLSIINSILDFSKLEAGKMELVPAEYSLKKLIHDVHIMINTRARQKNLDLVMDISERIPDKLYGDDVRLKQIIINLLTNAIKYTESGSIRLGIYGKESADNNIHLLVSVRDTGMGLKEDEKDKLFERFSRLDENKNRNIEGTGLGMSLVSGLLELMNSQLKVASIYGNGSDFYFEVEQKIIDKTPIGKVDWNEYVEEADEDYTVSFTAPDAKVLVVDDNEMNLMVFENLVRATEIEVDKAGSGQIALNLTNKYKYDIIYMDHMMPEMDGIETFKRIKSQPDGKNKETPIIILTANALQGARDEYEEIGFDAFLAKPIDPDALEENLEKYLPEELIKVGEEKKSVKKEKKPSRSVPQIEGVDVSYALEHVGSLEGVEKVAKQFVKVAISDATELEKYCNQIKFDNDNIDALENYRIKVHAMKTSASLIGALQVYGVAAQLEFAARDKKIQQVIETTPYFVEFWIDMYKKIKEYEDSIQDKTTKGSISNEILNPLLHQLMTSMSAYDVKSADGIITELEKYSVDPEISGKIEELKTAVANIDVDLCNQICGEIIK
nr:response regulator [Butyrivibrio sp.]